MNTKGNEGNSPHVLLACVSKNLVVASQASEPLGSQAAIKVWGANLRAPLGKY